MRRLVGITLLAVTIAIAGVAIGDSKEKKAEKAKMSKGETVTLTGILVDSKCFSMNPANQGQDHQTPNGILPQCAAACAKAGLPVALLTKDGQVHVLVAPAGSFADHMALEARATGVKVFGGSLRPDKVEVKGKDGKWSEISITTMM